MRRMAFVLCLLFSPMVAAAQSTISVTGQGSVSAAPDLAVITLGLTERDADPARAMDAVSAGVTTLLATLDGFGIAPADIQTTRIGLGPVYGQRANDGNPDIVGFEATNTVRVTVRDLGGLGTILSGVLESGANRMSGLGFALSDPAAALEDARRAAIADAQAKATLYAEAAGVALGPVLAISEGGSGGPQPMMMMEAARSAVPVAPGETEISASIQMVFAIAE